MAISLFKQKSVDDTINEYEKLQLAPGQRQIVTGISKVMTQFITMSPIAMNGFIWKAIKEWQIENQKTIDSLETATPEVRVREVGILFDKLGATLKRILKNSKDAQIIDEAITKGFDFYKSNFANR